MLFGHSRHNSLGGFAILSLMTRAAIEKVDLMLANDMAMWGDKQTDSKFQKLQWKSDIGNEFNDIGKQHLDSIKWIIIDLEQSARRTAFQRDRNTNEWHTVWWRTGVVGHADWWGNNRDYLLYLKYSTVEHSEHLLDNCRAEHFDRGWFEHNFQQSASKRPNSIVGGQRSGKYKCDWKRGWHRETVARHSSHSHCHTYSFLKWHFSGNKKISNSNSHPP